MTRFSNGWRLAVAALFLGLSWGAFSSASAQDPVILDVRTNNPNYKLYVDEPGAIIFTVDPNGNQVQGLVYALVMNFSGNNWIGPLSDQPPQSNVIYSPTAQSTFNSIAWNPFYGDGSSPDTILVSFTSFGGPWTFFDELFRLNVTPSITGGLTFNACPGVGCGAPTGIIDVLDPSGLSLPFEWRGEDREIISLVKPIGDTAYVDTTLVYLGQYDPGDTIWVGFGVSNTIPLGGLSYRIVLEDTSRITPAYVPLSGFTSGAVPIRPVNRGTSFDKPGTIVSGRIRHPDTTDIITGILVDFEGIAQIDVGSGTVFEIPFLAKAGIQAGESTRILVQDDISNPLEPRNSFSNVIGSQVVFPHLRDGVVRYRPQGAVLVDISTGTGDDTLYVGQPGSIIFSVNANGNQVQGLTYPYVLSFTGGNWIGPIGDLTGEVVPSASALSVFASRAWNPNYGQGTNPDTMLYGFTSFGGPWTISDEVFRILVTPTEPGEAEFHAIVPPDPPLPPSCCFDALDPGGASLPIDFEQDKVIHSVRPPILVDFVGRSGSDDAVAFDNQLFVGFPSRIVFSVDANGNAIQGMVFAYEMQFTGGNWIGPISDQLEVVPSDSAFRYFASISWNPNYGQGTDPDTLLYGFISFGGPWTVSDEVFRINFTPTGQGTVAFDSGVVLPPANVLSFQDPNGDDIPFVWQGEGKTITSNICAECFSVPQCDPPTGFSDAVPAGDLITGKITISEIFGNTLRPSKVFLASAINANGTGPNNPMVVDSAGYFSWQTSTANADDVGLWTLQFGAAVRHILLGEETLYCEQVIIDVIGERPLVCFSLGCVEAFSGSDVCIPLLVDNQPIPCRELGGFDLLFTYDPTLVTFTGLDLNGSVLESAGWEYLTYRVVSTNPAKIRIVAIADMNNSNQHPSEYCVDGLVANLCFRTTNDRNLACQSAWLQFCWDDCGDNTAASRNGNDLFIVADPANGPWAGGIIGQVEGGGIIHSSCGVESQLYEGLGGTTGPSELCCDSGHLVTDTLAPVFSPDFPLRIRGDANANKLPYEISDVVLFNNFLRDGLGALSPGPKADTQIVGMDVDGNWLAATAADLVLINQILVGRNSPVTDYVSGTAGVMQTSGTIDVSTSYADPTFEISAVTSHVVAGAMLKLTFSGTSILDVTGSGRTYASSVSHLTRSDTLFILLDNLTAFDTAIAIGSGPILEITTSGGGELTLFSVDAVTPQINGLASNLPPVQLGIPFVDTTFVKPCPTEGLYFVNGKIHIVCPGDIDDRGDLNLNSVAYEIADAVLYSNYFIEGPSVFQPGVAGEAQIAASDVNADGNPLLVADLVYLIRVITGDAQPIEGDLLGGGPKVAAGQLEVSLQPSGSTGKLNIASSHRLGAALVVIRTHGATINDVALGNLAESMDVAYRVKDGELRTLIYNIEDRAFVAPGAASLLEINTDRPGLLELVSVEAATFMGEALETNLANKVLPTEFALHPNYPNPFNPSTSMSIDFPRASKYNLTIYNVTGQVVRRFSGDALAGTLTLQWDGRDERGATVASGVYFSSLVAEGFEDTRKMLLLR